MELRQIKSNIINLSLRPIDMYKEVRRFFIHTNDLKKISIRCLLSIKRSVQFLAHQHNCHQIDIYRIAVNKGIPYLYSLPGIKDVIGVRVFLLKHAADLDDIRALEQRFFDLKTNETALLTGRFPEKDIRQCDNLADAISLNRSIICQMAMIHSLVRTEIPAHFHNQMAKVFIRFRKDIKRWGKRAIKLKKTCEMINGSPSKIHYEDIYGEDICEIE
jgi:hypothetical protein